MRRMCVGLAATAFVAALVSPAFAKMESVAGILVDEECYLENKANTKQKHAMKNGPVETCATSCAKKGKPIALVTTAGKKYIVTGQYTANKNRNLIAYMSHSVVLTGDVTPNSDGSATIAVVSIRDTQ
jgi:hypothetical protein